ncbi:MAG: hypothetical protein FWD73_09980, partial [Polyangiaceae bacterium]|nr:hypothetical protein [Polyangiaceae bacterium]
PSSPPRIAARLSIFLDDGGEHLRDYLSVDLIGNPGSLAALRYDEPQVDYVFEIIGRNGPTPLATFENGCNDAPDARLFELVHELIEVRVAPENERQ